MIKANELRINNILNYTTAENDILPTTLGWQDIKWISEDPKGFNLVHYPIPLTEEWLLKFGFETEDAEIDFMEYSIEYEDNSYIYTICNDGGLNNADKYPFYINLKNCGSKYGWQVDSKIEIKYVHTLQNIHFALTGQELKLK